MNEIIDAQVRTKEMIVGEIQATINQVKRSVMEGAIIVGSNLKELKELVPHGEWGDYIEDNLGMSTRKAQQYIQLSTEFGDEESVYYKALTSKAQYIAHLNVSTALKLLTIPEEDIEEVIAADVEEEKGPNADLEAKITAYKNDTEKLSEQLRQTKAQLDMLMASAEDGDKKNSEIDTLKSKIKKLDEKIASADRDKQEAIKKAEENARYAARQAAMAESDEELTNIKAAKVAAEHRADQAERKLQTVSNETLTKFKIHMDNLQLTLQEVVGCIHEINTTDPERAAKMKDAATKILKNILEG